MHHFNNFFIFRCWSLKVSRRPVTSHDTINSPTMWTPGATNPNRANRPSLPPPLKRTTTALPRSLRLPSNPRNPWTPQTTSPSQPAPPPKPNTSKIVKRFTPGQSSASRRRPASYPNRPATGSERTGRSRTARAVSRWAFTSSLCWRFRTDAP